MKSPWAEHKDFFIGVKNRNKEVEINADREKSTEH